MTMSGVFGGRCSRRRGRQASDLRTRARSIVPLALLGTCMIAALYVNASIYADKKRHAPDWHRPVITVPQRVTNVEGLKADATAVQADADPELDIAVELPSEEALPEAPTVVETPQEEGIQGEGDGGVEEHWDDDAGKNEEVQSFSEWEGGKDNKAPGKDGGNKSPVSQKGGGGIGGGAEELDKNSSSDAKREANAASKKEADAALALALAPTDGDEDTEEGAREGHQEEDVVTGDGEQEGGAGGGEQEEGETVDKAGEGEEGAGGGEGHEEEGGGADNGSVEVPEGVAASSTSSTVAVIQAQKKEAEGVEEVEGVEAQKNEEAKEVDGVEAQKKEKVEEVEGVEVEGVDGLEDVNVLVLEGVAASSTASTGGGEGGVVAEGKADSKEDGADAGLSATVPALDGEGDGEGARLGLAMDVKKENDVVAPVVEGKVHEKEEGGKGEAGGTTVVEGAAVDGTADESTAGVGAFPNGAVQGSMECATTREGEGAENIVNIATWKDVPGDAAYRGPMYQGLSEGNATKYITMEKDLGGFNNIRISLETGVAIAAATGRTFVIPPPFPIWRMNTKSGKKEVDLRDLFSFDKLRESGRVSVITTEEFIEKEALSGNLGISPKEAVLRLDVQAVTHYLEKVAAQYKNGLPTFEVQRSAFVLPRRLNERVELETQPYQFAKKWLFGRELVEYRGSWQAAKVIHWRSHDARLLAPFYTLVLHADEVADRYYKRLMRDLMHYPEEVYCKASQVIALLRQEDPSGEFSSFHVRRNDFLGAYKAVNIPPADVAANSMGHLTENEVIYIATDETNLSLFDPFKDRARVRFLSDYYERAGVSELSPNLLAMLEQVIASQGRTFTGCWFSTFTAYILRLRGHLQMPRKSNFSYYPPKRTYHHTYHLPENSLWASEWPFGWEDIDSSGVPDAMAP